MTGAPKLALTIGGRTRQAAAAAGTGNAWVRFSYTVAAADADADGLGVAAGALTLDGGTIRDADGQDAVLALGSHARTAFANRQGGRRQDRFLAGLRLGGRPRPCPDRGDGGDPRIACPRPAAMRRCATPSRRRCP